MKCLFNVFVDQIPQASIHQQVVFQLERQMQKKEPEIWD